MTEEEEDEKHKTAKVVEGREKGGRHQNEVTEEEKNEVVEQKGKEKKENRKTGIQKEKKSQRPR